MTLRLSDPDVECACGCGEPAPIATYSHAARGWIKGQPKRFVSGHNSRLTKARDFDASYRVEDGGCWTWLGYVDRNGYGRVNTGGNPQLAHRVMFERQFGWLPEVLHHKCKNGTCVNPAHLEPTNASEHPALEAEDRTHCRRGHAYAEHGRTHRAGGRYCRACERENERRRCAAPVH